ncbi:unnamed protein product [Cuscuta epithymum]|uniref:Glycosyltransferase n=1 Tax=Cuscuta epithymum TaxID=186058 RepID=A0AAV0FRV9_9ASTE|nr:unnamed protein product [Cuscuta epithymum]CAH9138327.1 unnamed protein product [Cuscuta epithymum]
MEFVAHVLIYPCPLQGHVNSMLKFAQLLDLSNFHVTFLATPNIDARLRAHTDIESDGRFSHRFRIQRFPAGIYEGRPDTREGILELIDSLQTIGKPFLKELVRQKGDSWPPFTCFVSDLPLGMAVEVGAGVDLPVYYFRTASAASFWIYFSWPDLLEAGEFPFKETEMDSPITKVKSMEDFLRARDLPRFFQQDSILSFISTETRSAVQARAVILNTFEQLEGPILSQIRTKCPTVYSIGPIHAHLKAKLLSKPASSNSLWQEDQTCMAWLDSQEPKSVIYVSFGSIAVITKQQLMEFWYGLVNSGQKFLWVVRPDSIVEKYGETPIPPELEAGTKANGYMVSWAPQELVLDHPAIGGFLTHSGWNSTLESIVAGVPMICWPFMVDQQTNSRLVGTVWKLGLDMKDVCDRGIMENVIRELMIIRKSEFLESAENMAKCAKEAVTEGGPSYSNFECLVQDICSLRKP